MVSPNIEEYLETLCRLKEKGKPLMTTEIAAALNVSPPSVTEMLAKLDKMGYVKYEPYKETVLTEKGIEQGGKVLRSHRLWERFLVDVLGIKKERVHEEACRLEHASSKETEDALCRMLKHPEKCPDGEEIPVCSKDVESCEECSIECGERKETVVPLASIPEGGCATVRFLRGGCGLVQRLADMGLSHGTVVRIVKSAPFGGSIEICVKERNLALGRGVASKIFVSHLVEGKKEWARK